MKDSVFLTDLVFYVACAFPLLRYRFHSQIEKKNKEDWNKRYDLFSKSKKSGLWLFIAWRRLRSAPKLDIDVNCVQHFRCVVFMRGIDALCNPITSKKTMFCWNLTILVSIGAIIDETKKHVYSKPRTIKPDEVRRSTNNFDFVLASKQRPSFNIQDMVLRVISSSRINVEIKSIMVTQLGSRTNAEIYFSPKKEEFQWEKFLEESESDDHLIGKG